MSGVCRPGPMATSSLLIVILCEAEESKLFPLRPITGTELHRPAFSEHTMVQVLESIHRTLPSKGPKLKLVPKDAFKGSQILNNSKNLLLVATVLVIVIATGLWLWVIPAWRTISTVPIAADKIPLQIELIQTIAQALLWFSLLATLYVAWRRATAAEDAVKVAQESQITERFASAIEQLGSDKMAIRLGGIYALERIANDSAKDHWQIVQVLTAYVRDKPLWENGSAPEASGQTSTTDIQAILTVLGRLNTRYGETGNKLDLRKADLRGTDLRGINFRGAILMEANLQGVLLNGMNLESADLRYSDFRRTDLTGANLQKAKLTQSDFRGADLTNANCQGANLTGADFQWGPLKYVGANLEGATPDAPVRRTALRSVNLRQAILRNAHFMGADLTSANLAGADLTGSHFGRMYITSTVSI